MVWFGGSCLGGDPGCVFYCLVLRFSLARTTNTKLQLQGNCFHDYECCLTEPRTSDG